MYYIFILIAAQFSVTEETNCLLHKRVYNVQPSKENDRYIKKDNKNPCVESKEHLIPNSRNHSVTSTKETQIDQTLDTESKNEKRSKKKRLRKSIKRKTKRQKIKRNRKREKIRKYVLRTKVPKKRRMRNFYRLKPTIPYIPDSNNDRNGWVRTKVSLYDARRAMTLARTTDDPDYVAYYDIGKKSTTANRGNFEKFTRRTTTESVRTTPLRVSLEEHCHYLAYYCMKAYLTGRVCARTAYWTYMTFKNYCMMDYVNCMERFEVWTIIHMSPCFTHDNYTDYNYYSNVPVNFFYNELAEPALAKKR